MHSVRILTSFANLGKGDFHNETYLSYPTCRIFNLSDEGSCDNARVVMFGNCRVPEALSPTYS